jgi:hypothetical protein
MTLKNTLENVSLTSTTNIEKKFEEIAKIMLYDGYLKVRNEYRVYIKTVEFYLHAEEGCLLNVSDPIVYHRNGKPHKGDVPYFPIMTLHAHVSGFDITFENEALKYRASALIRTYAIFDEKSKCFIETKKGYKYDDRSTYLYNYLNGFSVNGNNDIIWVDQASSAKHELNLPTPRRNVLST